MSSGNYGKPGLRVLALGTCPTFELYYSDLRYMIDGGDSRCMSQLYILQDFMNRVQRADGQKSGRPCDYFDLIVAVDGSAYVHHLGIISARWPYFFISSPLAVLLGVCGMTVEEAQDAYFKLYTDVFLSSDDKSSNARGEYMESALKETLQRLGIPETTKFSDPILHRYKSKVYVLYSVLFDLTESEVVIIVHFAMHQLFTWVFVECSGITNTLRNPTVSPLLYRQFEVLGLLLAIYHLL